MAGGYEVRLDPIHAAALRGLEEVAQKFENIGQASDNAKRRMNYKGPYQRMQEAEDHLRWARSPGSGATDAQRQDAEHRYNTAQQRVARAQGVKGGKPPVQKPEKSPQQQFSDAFADLIGTTRVSVTDDGKIQAMPLVNRAFVALRKMPAVGAAMAKLGLTMPMVTGALVALGIGAKLALAGINQLVQLGGASARGGGKGGGAAFAADFMAAAGMQGTPDALARSLTGKLQGGGIGSAYMRERGIKSYGQFDYMQSGGKIELLTKTMRELTKIEDKRLRTMIAADLGLEGLLPILNSSSGIRRLAGATSGLGMSEGDMQFGRDWQGTKAIGSNLWNSYWRQQGRRFGQPLTDAANLMGSGSLSETGANYMKYLDSVLVGLSGMSGGQDTRRDWYDKVFGVGDATGAEDGLEDAVRENTRMLRENTEFIRAGNRGTNALPSNWRSIMMEHALDTQAANLGAFQ
jgi:hypothetical protein